jgi:hypothetical protein
MTGFKVGDYVESPIFARGRVTAIRDGAVYATYGARGGSWVERYDAEWFENYAPLFKRLHQPDAPR